MVNIVKVPDINPIQSLIVGVIIVCRMFGIIFIKNLKICHYVIYMLEKTKTLYKNSKFRSKLITNILNGLIKIDPNTCNCLYKIEINPSNEITFLINDDAIQNNCDYATILHNLGYSLNYLGHGIGGQASQIC